MLNKKVIILMLTLMIFGFLKPMFVYASYDEGNNSVYVNGVEFVSSTDEDGNVVVNAIGLSSSPEMTLYSDGTAELDMNSNSSSEDTINMEFEELSSDSLEVEIEYDGKVESVETIDDILVDEYNGQSVLVATAAGFVTITVADFLLALVLTTAVVVIAGVLYKSLTQLADLIESSKNSYYPAVVVKAVGVFISPIAVSRIVAISTIKAGKDIYTKYKTNAQSIVQLTNLGVIGPELDKKWYSLGLFYYHYHTSNRNGAHSFYGQAY